MLVIAGQWIYMFWVFLSFGILGRRLFIVIFKNGEHKPVSEIRIEYLVLLGFALVSILLSYLSLFVAMGSAVKVGLIVVSVITSGVFWKDLKQVLQRILQNIKEFDKILIVFLLFAVVMILFLSVGRIYNYDTGLYHSQAILWIQQYAVVPGLGNLHGRFAFNSHFFIPAAIFIKDVPGEYLVYLLNSFFYVVFLFYLFGNITKTIGQKDYFNLILSSLLIFLSACYYTLQLSSPSPDMICGILICMTFLIFLESERTEKQTIEALLIAAMIFVCITFKLSTALLLLLMPFLWTSIKDKRLLSSIWFGVIVAVPFIIRNYYLSGYLVYPFPDIDIFNPDWKIPLENVAKEKIDVEGWARIPGGNRQKTMAMTLAEWVPGWYDRQPLLMKEMLITTLCFLIPMVISIIRKNYKVATVLGVLLVNLLFWFFSAPDPRFAYGFILFGASIVIAYSLGSALFKVKSWRLVAYALVIFCIVRPLFVTGAKVLLEKPPTHSIASPHFYPLVRSKNVSKEFKLYRPMKGDQCFNSAIPCTPYSRRNLVLRSPKKRHSFQDGFKRKVKKSNSNKKQ